MWFWFALSIATARILGPNAFVDYAVAVATLGMLSAAAEAGVGKFALKVIPEYTASRKWGLASGYWRFSLRVTLLGSVLLSVILMILEGGSDSDIRDDPLSVAGVFLPVVAMAGVGVDFVMANRAAVSGAVIARVIVPGTSLMLLISVGLWRDNIGAAGATAIFGIGSTVGLILCANVFRRTSPRQFFTTTGIQLFGLGLGMCLLCGDRFSDVVDFSYWFDHRGSASDC